MERRTLATVPDLRRYRIRAAVKVWVAEWDKKPTAVYGSYSALINAIAADGYDILHADKDLFETTPTFIYADDYVSAHEVEIIN
jgi:hypothetical protein